jgi:hypothetical protein
MIFLHLELILYVALVIIKLPSLCSHKMSNFLNLMQEDCSVLRCMYAERAISRIIIGSLCCWVFSSFAYLLAWGDPAVDDPQIEMQSNASNQDMRLQAFREGRVPTAGAVVASSASPALSNYPPRGLASFKEDPYAPRYVGDAVSVSSKYEPQYAGTSKSFHGAGSSFHGGGSFVGTSGRYPASQYVMPRASSSMQSQQSEATAERQMLIKPPIVIH